MLRITSVERSDTELAIKLAGRLLAPWVGEVRELFAPHQPAVPRSLDLSELLFADSAGAGLLLSLLAQGVEIRACSPFIAELLQLPRRLPGTSP